MTRVQSWGACWAVTVALAWPLASVDRAEADDSLDGGQVAFEPTAAAVAEAGAARCVCAGANDAADRIRSVLANPLPAAGWDFADSPLEEVVALLQEDYQIPIQLDLNELADVGLGPEEPVTITLRNISFRSALRLMLRQHQLTYVIRDEVLLITTPDEAELQLRVCVYAVDDLVQERKDSKAMDALIAAIVACVAPETWAVHGGGEAVIRPLPAGLLVISQTDAVHEEIGDLLNAIRRAGKLP